MIVKSYTNEEIIKNLRNAMEDKWKGTEAKPDLLGGQRRSPWGTRINWAKGEWSMCKSGVGNTGRSSQMADMDGVQHRGLGQHPGGGARALASESHRSGLTWLGNWRDKFQPLWASVTSFRGMWCRLREWHENPWYSRCPDLLLNWPPLFIEGFSAPY